MNMDLLISRLSIMISEKGKDHVFKLLKQFDQPTQNRLQKVEIDERFSKELATVLVAWRIDSRL